MKITKSVRRLYEELHEINKRLEIRVKDAFEAKRKSQWFFVYRIKSLESYALKLETGRIEIPSKMEDFFACTLVVENRSSINDAYKLVEEICDIVRRRPPEDGKTQKAADAFTFDDLRLYVKLKSNDALPPSLLNEVIFEVQIKTFLQHAWGIATHDLVYKGKSVDWGRARVAYQIKAMLEHAEVSVEQVNNLSSSSLLAISDEKTRKLRIIIQSLQDTWDAERLPEDLVRLSESILAIAQCLKLEIEEIFQCVKIDTDAGEGALMRDLSPYSVIVRSLYKHRKNKLLAYLRSPLGKFKLFLADDPDTIGLLRQTNGIRQEKLIYLGDTNPP